MSTGSLVATGRSTSKIDHEGRLSLFLDTETQTRLAPFLPFIRSHAYYLPFHVRPVRGHPLVETVRYDSIKSILS